MSQTKETSEEPVEVAVKVRDRRRFDLEGNVREEAASKQAATPETEPPAQTEEASRLAAELEVARRRVDELARAYQTIERDKEGFKARLQAERDRLIEVERGNVAVTLLEAVDELDLCLLAADQTSSLAKGVKLIRDGLLKKLAASGVERLHLVGRPFDPALAEAADMEITPRAEEDGLVSAELRAGYLLKERVIRVARVKVLRYVKPAEA